MSGQGETEATQQGNDMKNPGLKKRLLERLDIIGLLENNKYAIFSRYFTIDDSADI